MSASLDYKGSPLFTDDFTHEVFDVAGMAVDVLRTAGNLWLSAPATLAAMGFQPDGGGGGYNRRTRRASHPDIIKVAETPFRFSDGRRNGGSLISPRAVMMFAGTKVQGHNPIKAYAFIEWMEMAILAGKTPDDWSPAVEEKVQPEPVFRAVTIVTDEDRWGRPLDPFRPTGPYWGCGHFGPLMDGEIDIENKEFWTNNSPQSADSSDDDCMVIDYEDIF